MQAPLRIVAFTGVLAAVSLVGRRAGAYVREVNDTGQYQLYWSSSCETMTIYLNGFTAMTPDEVAKSIAGAASAWSPDAVTCPAATGDGGAGHPSFEIITQLATGGGAPGVHNDGKNSIIFQTTSWDASVSPDALAYTTVWKEPSGRIVDADIEINAINQALIPWVNLDPGAAPGAHGVPRYDLQTVMTHELGHLLGLGHTCASSATSAGDSSDQPKSGTDADGQPIPTCDDTGVPQYASVMWANVDSDRAKRTLSPDDARGVCAIYPPTRDSPTCTQNLPDDGCGCGITGPHPGPLAGLALALVALAFARWGRPRHRPARSIVP